MDGARCAAALVAIPGGRRTRFVRTEHEGAGLRFEAPAHDSPTWIRYAPTGDGLEAAIGDGVPPTATWRFQRVLGEPFMRRAEVEVCRRGARLEVTRQGCHCCAELVCAVVDAPRP